MGTEGVMMREPVWTDPEAHKRLWREYQKLKAELAEEREACARTAETYRDDETTHPASADIAAAIRARGEQ